MTDANHHPDRMTALAKLDALIMKCSAYEDHNRMTAYWRPAFVSLRYELTDLRAALSPAELGGSELPVGEVSDGFSGHQRAVNLYGPIRCQPAPGTKLYTAPQPAQAGASGGGEDWRETERLRLLKLRQLLEGFEVEIEAESLESPATYLDRVTLVGRFQPSAGGPEVAKQIAAILAAPVRDATPASPATGEDDAVAEVVARDKQLDARGDEWRPDREVRWRASPYGLPVGTKLYTTPQPAAAQGGDAAAKSAAQFLLAKYDGAECDARAVSDCIRCNVIYLAKQALAAAPRAQEAPARMSAWVGDMKTSAGMDYYVCVGRDTGNPLNRTYLTPNKYSIRGRAEYDVAEWNHLLGHGPKPDILAFDTDATPPAHGDGEGVDAALDAYRKAWERAAGRLFGGLDGLAYLAHQRGIQAVLTTRPTPEAQPPHVGEVIAEMRQEQDRAHLGRFGHRVRDWADRLSTRPTPDARDGDTKRLDWLDGFTCASEYRINEYFGSAGRMRYVQIADRDGTFTAEAQSLREAIDAAMELDSIDAALALPAQGEGNNG